MAAVATAIVVGATGVALGGVSVGTAVLIGVAAGALTFAMGSLAPEVPKTGTSTAQRSREQTITSDAPAQDRRIIYGRTRVGGIVVYKTVVEISGVRYLYFVVVWGDGPNEEIEKLYVQGELVTLDANGNDTNRFFKNGTSYIKAESRLGTPGQTAIDWAVSEIPGWSNDYKGVGLCYTIFRFRKDVTSEGNLFPNGVNDLQAVIKGRNDIFDPRTQATGYTANNALCFAHFVTLSKIGPGLDYGESIDEPQLIASANNCDEDVALKTGGFEKRYGCNGAISLRDNTEDIIALFAENMAGYCAQIGGRYVIQSGYYVFPVPTYTLDSDKIVEKKINYRTKPKWRERYNTVRGIFIGEISNWQPTDFPAYQNSSYLAEDGGKEQSIDLELPMCSSHTQAQRIAKIKLERIRRSKTVSCVTDCSLFRHRIFDTIAFDSGRHPVFDGLYYRIEQISLKVNEDHTMSVKAVLRQTEPAIFNWSSAEEKSFELPSVTSSGTTGESIQNFTSEAINQFTYLTDGTVKTSIRVSWTPPENSNYVYTKFFIKKSSEPVSSKVFIQEIRKESGKTSLLIENLEHSTDYDIFSESYEWYFVKGFRIETQKSGDAQILNQSTATWNEELMLPTVSKPFFSPIGGGYASGNFPIPVTINSNTGGATIRWSVTEMPESPSEGSLYVGPVSVDGGLTLYARAFKDGYLPSPGRQADYLFAS